ncbi:MT-A70-domain-containing protein [Phyllosticta capitalensis]
MDPILYRNGDDTVFLFDIPTSIAAAQGTKSCPARSVLLSRKPLTEPYGGAQLDNAGLQDNPNGFDEKLHQIYEELSTAALKDIEAHWTKPEWCLPRSLPQLPEPTPTPSPEGPHKRKRSESTEPTNEDLRNEGYPVTSDVQLRDAATLMIRGTLLNNLVKDYPTSIACEQRWNKRDQALSADIEDDPKPKWKSDDHDSPVAVIVSDIEFDNLYPFRIPPRASLLLSDCRQTDLLRSTVRRMAQDYDHPRKFDLVIMDPPWPNASAKHKKSYNTLSLKPLKSMLLKMDLDTVIATNGVVAVWITNSEQVRKTVLSPGGLFARLGVVLVEEWVWIKTTASGAPQSPIASAWRKPYEILLVGRVPDWLQPGNQSWTGQEAVKRRVIAAVPDLHSRKPCVKSLMEELVLKKGDGEYAGLELFGRYAVAGWFVWGNEAIKYNWEVPERKKRKLAMR